MRANMNTKTEIKRVYSHTKDLFNNKRIELTEERKKILEKHYNKMIEMYREELTIKIIKSNDKVDNLANRTLKRQNYKMFLITPEHGEYILASFITPKRNLKRREIIPNKYKKELKEEIYELRKRKQMNYIKKEYKNKFEKFNNKKIDQKESALIYRSKDYRNEKNKKIIYKLHHDKYFIKNKV